MKNTKFKQCNSTLGDARSVMPETKLWRAVFNQALEDGFGLYNTHMCDYEKHDAELFFRTRTHQFDEICENAQIDPDVAWKTIQKHKLIQKGIVNAKSKREILVVRLLDEIKQQRRSREFARKKPNRMEGDSHNRSHA